MRHLSSILGKIHSGRIAAMAVTLLALGLTPAAGFSAEPPPGRPEVGQGKAAQTVLTTKALERRFDVVIVTGDQLGTLQEKEISHLRLYAGSEGKLTPIPYQIDERDPEGEFIFTGGDAAGEDVDQGRFDANDELIFVCGHAGDRVPRTLWPGESTVGHEIVISDSRDLTKKAWAYLFYFPGDPPAPSEKDYISYDPESDRVVGKYYTVGYEKGYALFTDLIYAEESGGNGQDFLDRLKFRVDVQLLGGMVRIRRTEGDIRCKVIGWKEGPIRVLRNAEMYFRILFNIPSPSLFSVTEYYPHYFTVPMRFNVPFNMKYVMNSFVVSGFAFTMYADFLSVMLGAGGHTNSNPQGHVYTGDTSKEELLERYELSGLAWGYFKKEGVGVWCARMAFPDAFLQYFNIYLRDDMSADDDPEDEKGILGGGAFVYSKSLEKKMGVPGGKTFTPESWNVIQKGTFELSIDTYISSIDIQPKELEEWMAIRDYPLWVDVVQEQEEASRVVGEPDPALVKAVIFDKKGRQINLRDLVFHIGSPRTTGWNHVIGFDVVRDKWHVIPFEEIQQMDFNLEESDVAAGRPSRMFIKIAKKDGTVLDLLNAKSASFAGHVNEKEKIFIWNPWIKRIELRD